MADVRGSLSFGTTVYTNRVVSMLSARLVGAQMIRSTLLARILRLTLNQTSVLLIVDEFVIV